MKINENNNMKIKNTKNSYGSIAKILHWLIAIAIIFMLFLGFFMSGRTLYTVHKSLGITILIIMILRVLWKLANSIPELPKNTPKWQKVASDLTHLSLYLLAFILPFSGWIMSTASNHAPNFWWWFKWPLTGISANGKLAHFAHDLHGILAWVIIGFICLHILAALKHHFINKDDVLKRML